MARGGARTASTTYRLPTEGDHPVRWTVLSTVVAFGWGFAVAVGDRRGFGLSPAWGLGFGAVAASITVVAYGLWVRRVPRGLALRVGPEGLTFAQGRTERWTIAWEEVTAAGVVHSNADGHTPGPSYLRLELAGRHPDDPALLAHDGAWLVRLTGFDTAARLHHDLLRRIPGRVQEAVDGYRFPTA